MIAIITLLSFASLPALRGFSAGNNRKAAANLIISLIDQARATAQQYGTRAYLIFANNCINSTTGNPTLAREIRARAMRIMRENSAAITSPNPDSLNTSLIPVTRWIYLPKNIEFKINDGCSSTPLILPAISGFTSADLLSYHSKISSFPQILDPQGNPVPIPISDYLNPNQFTSTNPLPAIVFSPDGTIDFAVSGALVLFFGEVGRPLPPQVDAIRINRYTARATYITVPL
ncbi:MAG: hypothetical protein NZM04_01550 [Methylacidiphilales bacterium]|nr:hypothetical protein [Candidatus Methylacidiphilales bacterium]MDW8349151.1 hypothetical protein [Verrucomicrobiae bacterium]